MLQHPAGELHQRLIRRLMVTHAPVVDLLTNPGSFAKNDQADHPGTALEGVECAPNGGQQIDIVWCSWQRCQRLARIHYDVLGLFQEDLSHFSIVGKIFCRGNRLEIELELITSKIRRIACFVDELFQCLGQLLTNFRNRQAFVARLL